MKTSIIRSFVNFLLQYALLIMPEKRADWVQAMKNESQYLSNDFQALLWVIGCVKTATIERINMMKTGSLRVSKFVLSIELLSSFIPVSFVLLVLMMNFIEMPSIRTDGRFIIYAALGLIGPIGIILGLRLLLRGPYNLGKVVNALLGILAVGIVTGGMIQLMAGNINLDDWWLVLILITLMPAVALFHIIYLTQEKCLLVQQ